MFNNNKGFEFNFLESFYDEVFISTNLDYTRCFSYQGIPLNYQGDDQFSQNYITVIDALNSLDLDLVISFVKRNSKEYRPILEKHITTIKNETPFQKRRIEHLKNQYEEARAIEQYLFVTLPKYPESLLSSFNKWNPLSRPNIKYGEEEHLKRKDILDKSIQRLLKTLSEAGLIFKEMDPDEVAEYCFYHLNHSHKKLCINRTPFVYKDKNSIFQVKKTIREQVLDSEIILNVEDENKKRQPYCFKLGDKYVTTFSVDVLGTHNDSQFYEKLSKYLPENHEYLVKVERIENESLFKLFKENRYNSNLFQVLVLTYQKVLKKEN